MNLFTRPAYSWAINSAFGLALLLIASVNVLSLKNMIGVLDASQLVARSHQAQGLLQRLLPQRRKELGNQEMRQLRALTGDDPSQLRMLRAADRLARQPSDGNRKKPILQGIVVEMHRRETRLLRDKLVDTQDSVKQFITTLAAGSGISLALLLGVFAFLNLQIRKRAAAEEKLNVLVEKLRRNNEEIEAVNKELETFSYSASHDLRAPLRAIDGFSRILLEEHSSQLDAEGRRLFEVIRRNSRKMGQLIDDLLAFSRLGRKEISKSGVNMTSLAIAAFEDLKASRHARLPQCTIKELPKAYGDAALLRQVLSNLLSNAVKFTGNKDDGAIEVGGESLSGNCEYWVKDNGAGFDMRYAKKLFGVFQRLHGEDEFEGTGVGLAIVQRVIHRHGGRVWAEGRPNQGATFHFSLPSRNGGHYEERGR